MARSEFANLVGQLIEAMGQSMASMREVAEGMLLQTSDGFLYAFVEDPDRVSLGFIQRLQLEVGAEGSRLVVLTPGRLPLALSTAVAERSGTVVESARFRELARGLGLGPLLGDEPRATPEPTSTRLLPSARQLDEVMTRARTWAEWGVPALALRFYGQAAAMKPEFLPAKNGIAESLLGLGLPGEATKAFAEVLATDPSNVDARIGQASVLGRTGRIDEEIRAYRDLLSEDASRVSVRAHLVAALIDSQQWPEARREIEAMLEAMPDSVRLRYLHSATLERTGETTAALRERERARAMGLPYEAERSLAAQLGLAPPPAPTPPPSPPPPPRVLPFSVELPPDVPAQTPPAVPGAAPAPVPTSRVPRARRRPRPAPGAQAPLPRRPKARRPARKAKKRSTD